MTQPCEAQPVRPVRPGLPPGLPPGLLPMPSPMVLDVLLVVVVLVVSIGHDLVDISPQSNGWFWVFDIALTLPLLMRRRRPTETFFLVAAIALGQWLVGGVVSADFAVLVALYSVGVYARQRWAVAATAAVAQLGVVLAGARWAPPGRVLTSFILMTGTVTAAWVLGIYVQMRRTYLASILDRASTAERERDQQVLLAAAGERDRIAREMHDIVAHTLAVMIALSDGAVASLRAEPDSARDAMAQSSRLGRQALGEVRRLLGTVSDDEHSETRDGAGRFAPPPGIGDLDALVAQVRAAGLGVDLVIVGRPLELRPAAQLTIYRVVQEALTNVLKHAEAANLVTVTLSYGNAGVEICIENDDVPREPVPAITGGAVGRGLAGMRERAALFKGSVQAGPRPAGGWRVSATLVVDDVEPADLVQTPDLGVA